MSMEKFFEMYGKVCVERDMIVAENEQLKRAIEQHNASQQGNKDKEPEA